MTWQPLAVDALGALLENDDTVVLDIRDATSFARGHIPGAQPGDEAAIKRLIRARNPGRPIVVCCYHGNSSRDLCRLLAGFGFTHVYNLEGGWQAWQNAQSATTPAADGELAAWMRATGFDTANLNSRIGNGMSPLMSAAHEGHGEFVAALLAHGADVNLLNDDENGALWFACVSGDTALIRSLVAAGADLDNQNVNGATCLIYAASTGKLDVLTTLIDAGADPGRRTLDGFTALDSASTLPVLRFLKPHFAA